MAQSRNLRRTGDFNATGDMSANALIGARVRNANGDVVCKVEDLYPDSTDSTKALVISVGGFLGIGSKDVAEVERHSSTAATESLSC